MHSVNYIFDLLQINFKLSMYSENYFLPVHGQSMIEFVYGVNEICNWPCTMNFTTYVQLV